MASALDVEVRFQPLGADHVASAPADGQYRQTLGGPVVARGRMVPISSRAVQNQTGSVVNQGWRFTGRLSRDLPLGTRAEFLWDGRTRQGQVDGCTYLGPTRAAVVTIVEAF